MSNERARPVRVSAGCALFLSLEIAVNESDIEAAFGWVEARGFDLAVPMRPYHQLANAEGTEEERTLTAELIRDLRVPLYDTRLRFVGKTDDARELLAQWRRELKVCTCESKCGLAFLRALWRVKPRLLSLPAGWVNEKVAA